MKSALDISPLRKKFGLHLLEQHAVRLEAAGITPEMAEARGYRSITTKADLGRRGFTPVQRRVPGLLIPGWGVHGKPTLFSQYRPDEPRLRGGKAVKYETPRNVRLKLDVHPFAHKWLGDPAKPLFFTEGVLKGDALVARGLTAVALPGVWGWRGTNDEGGRTALPDFEWIALNDRPGYVVFDSDVVVKREVHEALRRFREFLRMREAIVRVIYLPPQADGAKQGVDDFLARHSIEELLALAADELREPEAVAISPGKRVETLKPNALRARAAPVLEGGDPLTLFENSLRECGYGGDPRPVKIAYVAATGRVLAIRQGGMPAHLLFLGQTSTGKNWTVKTVLRYLPPEACHVVDAASPRALIYDDSADLQHRVLVFWEADSLPAAEENTAASAIRNLMQDHFLHYQVVEKDKETGKYTTRKISKPGPTTLFTTGTRHLPEQFDSRVYNLEVPDDQAQIRAALETQAELELAGIADPPQTLVDYQQLLQDQAPWQVVVPFARVLATAIGKSPAAPRVMRDFQRLLTLIKAAAVLRHPRRQRDDQGRLVAELEDYALVYELIADMYVATTTGAGATARATVEAVAALKVAGQEPITATAVAKYLAISTQAATGRIATALRGGWLINREERPGPGKPYRLDVGEPLTAGSGLPTPSEVGTQGFNLLAGGQPGGAAEEEVTVV